ncbi:alkaline phosphatase family protein [Leptolyngbya sp. FACHB-261]|uniref:alkaline phosphatase family protein n=1 Tax=Leptolyngbya sp. FACHB-261 TaxID=2692806 RepID=UPI001685EE35|nr:alkaline phosphatase family protein [Leptolyngbya sp. FACHB-261]MBD2103617.1 alkaline phosphatase family protein [Leptolyngbya sp. FACHB-261]
MKKPVIAIGMDAADPALLEAWMSQGHLKNLSRLRAQGAYTRLSNFHYYRAETPWTTFLTGRPPEETGFWGPVKLREGTYDVRETGAYDFKEHPPFYALGEDYRVAVFDTPQSTLSDQVNGMQALAWGAHSPLTPSHSRPEPLLSELIRQHGKHPVLNRDHADCRNLKALLRLQKSLETGIARRATICQDLLERDDWDLFLTVFGETHSAGHYMWHLSQPHPLYKLGDETAPDALLATFEAIDRAIGDILTKAPADATVAVFAAHGMGSNVMDLPSMVFLPELLYRWNFGKPGLAPGRLNSRPKPPITSFKKRGWVGEVWSLKHDSNPLRGFLRREAPTKIYDRLEKFLGAPQADDLVSPYEQSANSDSLYWQPANWYRSLWPKMKAFGLPSYSEGYVRINLEGREPEGQVPLAEYNAVCDEISQHLYQLKDARTGKPMVREIVRTRATGAERDPKLPSADLVVLWQEENATDVVDSPDFGRIGPVPFSRTGSHRSEGFFMAQGPGIESGATLPPGHSLDLAPTILELMGAPIPSHFEGKPLLQRSVPSPVA